LSDGPAAYPGHRATPSLGVTRGAYSGISATSDVDDVVVKVARLGASGAVRCDLALGEDLYEVAYEEVVDLDYCIVFLKGTMYNRHAQWSTLMQFNC
jgi:hypothetical protein